MTILLTKMLQNAHRQWQSHKSRISDLDNLREFIRGQSAKICGEAVMKYAQKRLGKMHFQLSKTTPEYCQDLVDCQAQLHAEVLADIYSLLLHILRCESDSCALQPIMIELHKDYIASAPLGHPTKEYLSEQHFERESRKPANLANATGQLLFSIIPAKNGLLPENVSIFQGQLRLSYIAFLEKFNNKADISSLRKSIC